MYVTRQIGKHMAPRLQRRCQSKKTTSYLDLNRLTNIEKIKEIKVAVIKNETETLKMLIKNSDQNTTSKKEIFDIALTNYHIHSHNLHSDNPHLKGALQNNDRELFESINFLVWEKEANKKLNIVTICEDWLKEES